MSGIILNHRHIYGGIDVSRGLLPPWYRFENWNGGLLRGTVAYGDSVLVYGSNGIWVTDLAGNRISDFNRGLPDGADNRQIRSLVATPKGIYALSQSALYRLEKGEWRKTFIETGEERLSDLTAKGDTLIVTGRSCLYMQIADREWKKTELKRWPGDDGKVTLFKTVWNMHSGELFGLAGKVVVDILGIILIVLCVAGLTLWLLPKTKQKRMAGWIKGNLKVHNAVGRYTIVFTMLIVVTGWCLRPPVMVALAFNKTKPIPGSTLDSDNPWHDRLRVLRYDERAGDWLLSASDGFYRLAALDAVPDKVDVAPPVSVMGLNVMERDKDGNWLCGSFSGMYRWNRRSGRVTDYFSGDEADLKPGPPFGKYATAGYSAHFDAVAEYYGGTDRMDQPEELSTLPMSLWNVALEAHSGRLFIGPIATYVYIFVFGLAAVWCLLSGWKIRKR